MIAIDFAFVGGAAQDAPGKGGTANLVASLLDEGAGDLDAKTFHARLERKAIELGFQAERDTLRGTLRTLTENKDEAFEYLRLAVDAAAFRSSRCRSDPRADSVAAAPRDAPARPTSPICAGGRWRLPIIPMAVRSTGRSNRVPTVTIADLKDYTHRVLARGNLKVAVVGDIDAETVKVMLDRVFGGLPAQPELKPVPNVDTAGTRTPHRGQARRAAGRGDFRRPRHCAQGPGFHGRLYRQSHPRRRRFLLAALPRSAGKARARLLGL